MSTSWSSSASTMSTSTTASSSSDPRRHNATAVPLSSDPHLHLQVTAADTAVHKTVRPLVTLPDHRTARARWREDRTFRNALIASLFCCLFPLSGSPYLVDPSSSSSSFSHGPVTNSSVSSTTTSPSQTLASSGRASTRVSSSSRGSQRSASPSGQGPWSCVRNGILFVGTRTIPSLLRSLQRRTDNASGNDDPKTRLFIASVNKFLQQFPSFKTSDLADSQMLIMLFGALVTEGLREKLPDPSLATPSWQGRQDSAIDDALLAQTEMFLHSLREAVASEPDSTSVLSHHFLHPGAAWELPIRSLLAVFLDNPPTRDSAPRIDHLDAEISSRSPNPTTTTPGLITKFGRLEAADGVSRIQEILVQDGKSTARQGVGALTMADWLRKVFQLDEETMDKAIAQVKAICNDRIAFNELERYLEQLENADVPSAPSSDWEKQEVYNAWRDKEILIMMAFRMSYLARMPGLKKLDEPTNLFLPPQPSRMEFFKILVRQCLVYDIAHSRSRSIEASKFSRMVIAECAYRWQISKKSRDAAFLETLINLYFDGQLTMEDIFPLLARMVDDSRKTIHHFRISDKKAYLQVLRRLDHHIRKFLKNFTVLFNETPAVARTVLQTCVDVMEKVRSDAIWIELSEETEDVEDILFSIFKDAVIARYEFAIQPIGRDPNHHIITRLCLVISAITKELDLFHEYFPEKILDKAFLPSIVHLTYVELAVLEMESLRKVRIDASTPIEAVMGPNGLYRAVLDLYKKVQFRPLRAKLDIEGWFEPFVMDWLSRTEVKWREWAENAVAMDAFEPVLPPASMHSSAVRDVFIFFNNGLNFMMQWTSVSATKREDMIVLFLQMIYHTLQTFTGKLLEEFIQIQCEPRESVQCITYEACIKLNNVIGAKSQLADVLDSLGVQNRKIAPNTLPSHQAVDTFEITIGKAIDVDVSEAASCDTFVEMSVGGTARQRTRTVFKSFTPAWNESFAVDIPTGKKADKCFLDFFLCDRYGNQTSEVSARTTVQDRVFLRDQLYDDHEFHELRLPLKPQGTLIVQIRKEGEVQNIDYWVRRSEELLDSTAHKMVNTLVQRIADHTSYAWAVVLDKIASFSPPPTPPPTFSTIFFPQPPTTPPPQPTVESEALQILEYLDRNMSLLNEGLDRNLLNNFLRKLYPILGPPVPVPRQKVAHNAISAQEWDEMDSLLYSDGDSDNHSDLVSDASSPSETGSDSDVSEDPVLREMIQNQAKRELNAPSLLCRVVWMELASRMLRDVQVYARGGGPPTTASGPGESANFMNVPNGSGGRLVFAPRTTSVSAIDEDDVKQIEALDGILEMIKAFFFNEIAGRCNGFPLRILEDDVYRQAKALIANLCIRHEEALH